MVGKCYTFGQMYLEGMWEGGGLGDIPIGKLLLPVSENEYKGKKDGYAQSVLKICVNWRVTDV